jgi:hypothetical protein
MLALTAEMFMGLFEEGRDTASLVVGQLCSMRVLQMLTTVSKQFRWMAVHEELIVRAMRGVKLNHCIFAALHLPTPMLDYAGNISPYLGSTFNVLVRSMELHADYEQGHRVPGSYVVNMRRLHKLKMRRIGTYHDILASLLLREAEGCPTTPQQHHTGRFSYLELEVLPHYWIKGDVVAPWRPYDGVLQEYLRTGRLVEPWTSRSMPVVSFSYIDQAFVWPSSEDMARCDVRAFRIHSATTQYSPLTLRDVVQHVLYEVNFEDPKVCNVESLMNASQDGVRGGAQNLANRELLRLLGLGDDQQIYPFRLKDFVPVRELWSGKNLEACRSPRKLSGKGILDKLEPVIKTYQCEVNHTQTLNPKP